jgi:myosin-crossreactive antigen
LYPGRSGDFVKKAGNACNGAEILEEVLRHLHFEQQLARSIHRRAGIRWRM